MRKRGMYTGRLLTAALSASVAATFPQQSEASLQQVLLPIVDGGDSSRWSLATDSSNHNSIDSYTALGDSYSVGVGAGHAISAAPGLELNTNCSQFSYGYPNILNMYGMLPSNPNRKFQYFGCSGATTTDIREKQVPRMQKAQLVTLSAGGNDANLATILNLCIYQWSVDFHVNCEEQLAITNDAINGDAFMDNLANLLESIRPNILGPDGRLYWIGYPRFWNTETKECDTVTWAFSYQLWNRQFLTLDRRRQMNSLVDSVNAKIQSVCNTTEQCVYVNPQADVDTLQGHFCEPGVDETYRWFRGGASKDRVETWFYEWGTTKDDDGNEVEVADAAHEPDARRHDVDWLETLHAGNGTLTSTLAPDGTSFEGAITHYVSLGLQSGNINNSIFLNTSKDDVTLTGTLIGTPYGRVFHLDKFANMYIARRILDAMSEQQSRTQGTPPQSSE